MWAFQLLTYLALVVFIVVVGRKARKYASAPMHLRWELYPVPHEVGKEYGGSYLEEIDWWKKPRQTSLVGEIKGMVPEMLLIAALYHHNRKLWYVSYPFHGGMYLIIGFIGMLVVGAIAQAFGASGTDPLLGAWNGLATVVGVVGMLSVTVGSLGLLLRRLNDEELHRYSVPADYFNLAFILLLALSGLYSWLTADPSFAALRAYVQGLLTLSPAAVPGATLVPIVLLSLFLIYMPFTHMTHFVGKWFTYHTVRWDDAPASADATHDKQLGDLLGRQVGWSAPHIGKGTWAEVATREVEK